ncbi:MAG: hypothetical protein GY756_14335, partial [bacterium]|nr:hypothetical protein [bacterium]
WFVKWFSIDGDLRYTVPINKSFIPMPADETDLIPTLEGIIPDLNEYKLYIEMSYYKENKDEDIGEVFSGIYSLNVLPEAKYYGWARLPDNKVTIEDIEINTPYMLIGNIDEYLLYISYCREGMYKLLISNNSGEFIQEKILNINAHNIIYWNFYLSNEGILSGMFFTEEDVKIIWWRTDKLINGRKSE